jgi:DivIVA domain-containing protein
MSACNRVTPPNDNPGELSRRFIVRADFPVGRRGYDRDSVDRHLRAIADAVSASQHDRRVSDVPLTEAASEQLRSIIETAERTASQLTERAERHAERVTEAAAARARDTLDRAESEAASHLELLESQAAEILERVDSLEAELNRFDEIDGLVEGMRSGSGALRGEIEGVISRLAEVRDNRPGSGNQTREFALGSSDSAREDDSDWSDDDDTWGESDEEEGPEREPDDWGEAETRVHDQEADDNGSATGHDEDETRRQLYGEERS